MFNFILILLCCFLQVLVWRLSCTLRLSPACPSPLCGPCCSSWCWSLSVSALSSLLLSLYTQHCWTASQESSGKERGPRLCSSGCAVSDTFSDLAVVQGYVIHHLYSSRIHPVMILYLSCIYPVFIPCSPFNHPASPCYRPESILYSF